MSRRVTKRIKVPKTAPTNSSISSSVKSPEKQPNDMKRKSIARGGEIAALLSHQSKSAQAPPAWHNAWREIVKMRSEGGIASNAAVDTMGCESWFQGPNIKDARFSCLLSLMLSSQTKDEQTNAAMERLRAANLLNIERVLATSEEALGKILYGVGFWRKKAVYVQKAAALLKERHGGDVPNSIEALCALPGVGPKMSALFCQAAYGDSHIIGVDVHVARISQRLGWVSAKAQKPEQCRVELEAWLPKPLWSPINLYLVGLGQKVCKPQNPQCEICLAAPYCKTGKKVARSSKKSGAAQTKKRKTVNESETSSSSISSASSGNSSSSDGGVDDDDSDF